MMERDERHFRDERSVDIDVRVIKVHPRAFLVLHHGGVNKAWLSRDYVRGREDMDDGRVRFKVPAWWAKERGF